MHITWLTVGLIWGYHKLVFMGCQNNRHHGGASLFMMIIHLTHISAYNLLYKSINESVVYPLIKPTVEQTMCFNLASSEKREHSTPLLLQVTWWPDVKKTQTRRLEISTINSTVKYTLNLWFFPPFKSYHQLQIPSFAGEMHGCTMGEPWVNHGEPWWTMVNPQIHQVPPVPERVPRPLKRPSPKSSPGRRCHPRRRRRRPPPRGRRCRRGRRRRRRERSPVHWSLGSFT